VKLDRPILVTGTPRSGKTCVWEVLRRADEVHGIREPIAIWSTPPRGRADDCRTADDATENVKTRIVRACAAAVDAAGKGRYLDDLAYHALRLPFVQAVLPEARVIHMIRDPLDAVPEIFFGWTLRSTLRQTVRQRRKHIRLRALPRLVWRFARSYVRSRLRGCRATWGPVVPGLADYVREHTAAEIAAFQWVQMVEIARRDARRLPDLAVLEVRYDRLVADPAVEMLRIARFAELDDPDRLVRFAGEFLEQDYVHWEENRRDPSEEEWEAIRRIVTRLREELGFDDVR